MLRIGRGSVLYRSPLEPEPRLLRIYTHIPYCWAGIWGKFAMIKKSTNTLYDYGKGGFIVFLYFLAQTQQMKMERNKNEKSKRKRIRGK